MSTLQRLDFWIRFGVSERDAQRCTKAVRGYYPGFVVTEFQEQGQCSFTLLVVPRYETLPTSRGDTPKDETILSSNPRPRFIVQIRPAKHGLNLSIAQTAKAVYPTLAPRVRMLKLDISKELCLYEMEKLTGTPLSRVLPRHQANDAATRRRQESLIESFASFIAQSWHVSVSAKPSLRTLRADSPMSNDPIFLSQCKGKVGSSIIPRLEMLATALPDPSLRSTATRVLRQCRELPDFWPVVLNHGDLIPSNILVDEETWEITGVVDWAEGEELPFGMCLYGLEHLLGYLAPAAAQAENAGDGRGCEKERLRFLYYDNALDLRERFWRCLMAELDGEMVKKENFKIMRDGGVLLWYGIAWDDGAIDRVINEVDDPEELAYLRAFLDVDR